METYYIKEPWDRIDATIKRPEGFVVYEEVDWKPCTEFRGSNSGRFAVYLLEKKGIDHFAAISRLQAVLKRKVNYAGMKDANAITYQLIYIDTFGEEPQVKEWEDDKIRIKFLGFIKNKYNHTGNIFEITLDVGDDLVKELERRVSKIAEVRKLPAFIGYQRFGTRRPITHVVGKMLVLRDWCAAVDYIVGKPFPYEGKQAREFRTLYDKGKYEEALEKIPKKFYQERAVLKALINTGSCFHALKASKIPLSFYVEAFQSYLFNRCLSESADESAEFIEVPARLDRSDGVCREVMVSEGVHDLNVDELKVKVGTLKRKKFMEVRGIRIHNKTVSFALDRGMYATVVLREILRTDPLLFT